jgi:hypothetical protein
VKYIIKPKREMNMAHFKLENVSVSKIIIELKDNTKKPILNNIIEEMKECKKELMKFENNNLILYKIYLESVLDKLTNISHFIAVIAFSGVLFSIMGQFYLKFLDVYFSNAFLGLLLILALIVIGTYPIMTRRRSRIVLVLKLIDLIIEEHENQPKEQKEQKEQKEL